MESLKDKFKMMFNEDGTPRVIFYSEDVKEAVNKMLNILEPHYNQLDNDTVKVLRKRFKEIFGDFQE